mmetsp:Transcript_72396/g.160875  ORF Transcript_72396/g.160875 Transcript_72396/m.160875 type:complete len:207 (-) Transcript_72396:971-1591(-)
MALGAAPFAHRYEHRRSAFGWRRPARGARALDQAVRLRGLLLHGDWRGDDQPGSRRVCGGSARPGESNRRLVADSRPRCGCLGRCRDGGTGRPCDGRDAGGGRMPGGARRCDVVHGDPRDWLPGGATDDGAAGRLRRIQRHADAAARGAHRRERQPAGRPAARRADADGRGRRRVGDDWRAVRERHRASRAVAEEDALAQRRGRAV